MKVAVRRYRPGLSIETSQPFSHPLALAHRIINWPGGSEVFANLVVDRTLSATITGLHLENELPSFQEFSSVAIEISRSEAKAASASDEELLELADTEIKQLQLQLRETKETSSALMEQADNEIAQLKASLGQVQEDSKNQRWRIAHLEEAINKRQEAAREPVPIPDSFDSLEEWCRLHLSGSVAVHNRAIRAAKKSTFQNVGFAYSVLLLLRDKYVPMRREGGLDRKNAYDKGLAELGLNETPAFGGARSGEEGEAYFVEFGGRKRELDRHLKGSNSRDERFGFRLYFFWDDETDQAVVGWFPSHLPTRVT